MKKMFLAGASLLVLSSVTTAFTNDTDKVVNATGNLLIDTINERGIFEWISGGIQYTDKTLSWDITAFSNLRETKDTVTYLQTSYNRQKSTNRLNLGLGYRKLIDTTTAPLIVGVNAFFDSKDGTKNILAFKSSENFQRFSVGAELKTARFDLSTNLYRRIGNNIIDDKKVLQGWDITAKGNIPNYEQVSVGVGTYRFDGVGDTVVKGNKLIAEFKPNTVLTVRGEYDKPNGESAKTDISLDFKLAFGKSISEQLQSAFKSAPVSPSTDAVWQKRYDKVERQYDIRTAEAQSTPTLGTAISSAELAANKISSGDGTTEQSAYTLQNGEQYDVSTFIGDVDDSLKTKAGAIDTDKITVTVVKVSGDGVKSTGFELYASDGTTIIGFDEVQADSQLKDLADGKAATLKLTYSASGFEDRVVYVSVDAISQIGSVLSDSDKISNNIKGGDGTSRATAYTLTNNETYDVETFIGTVPTGVTPTVTAERVSGTSGTDFQFKNGSTNVAVGSATYTSTLEDKAGAGAAVIKLTYRATNFDDRIVYVKTDIAFVAANLTLANLVVPYASGTVTVSTADILGKLTVTGGQTQKSDWSLKSLADTDSHDKLVVNGKTLVISGAIPSGTTVTAVFEHSDSEYADQSRTFELSTAAGSLNSGTHTGSGKWGQSYTTDYKLKTSDTVGDTTVTFDTNADFTFEIVAPATTVSGFTSTTTGIVQGALTGAINADTGAIDGTKLTKSGTLLVKIVRKAKGGLPQVTDYANLPVAKQTATDHTGFTVSASPIVWATASTAVTYTENASKPAGIGSASYALTASGTTAGATTGADAITVASNDGKIGKTTKSGVVKVKITYAANDKYAQITRDVDVAVNKQSVPISTLTAAKIIVPYMPDVSGTEVISTTYILDELFTSSSAKSDWSIKSLANTDSHASVAVASGGKSLIISGGITTTTTTITVVLESSKYVDMTRIFELSTRVAQVIDGTPTGLSSKWGKGTVTPDYKLDLDDQGQTFVKATDYTFSIVPSSDGGKGGKDATTAGIFSSNPISNAKTGAIDTSKLTKSGKLLIKIVRAAKGSGANAVAAATEYVNFDVTKQVLGTDVTTAPAVATATGENGKWKDSTSTKINLDYTLPGSTDESDYTWAVGKKSGAEPDGTLAIDSSGDISGATSSGTAEITITAKGSNAKYSGSIRTADFAIAKQTGTDTLSMADLVIPYVDGDSDRTVTTAEILGQLSVSSTGTAQTQKSQWTLASVANTDNNGDLAVTGGGKTLTISDEIPTKTTVTAVLSHPAYENKTVSFELSTEPSKISTGGRTGSGKWGKSYTTDYKLKGSVGSVNFVSTDYTFSIVAPGGDDGSGKTQTTAGIVQGALTGAIGIRNGVIDASKLTKSGALLIKIVRAAKGTGASRVDAVTEYQNFTVSKQDSTDHTGFAVSAGAITWNANSQTVSYDDSTNKPTGIGSASYALVTSGTTAGATTGADAVTVASSDGKIGKTTKSGVVKVKVTYAANDKYETITRDVDVTINKQTGSGRLSMDNLVIPYGGSDTTVSTATITGKLTVPNSLGAKSEWTLTGLRNSDGNSNITIGTGGNSLTITGAITTNTTVSARFESDKYVSRVVDFELSTGAGAISTSDARTGLRGKWGVGFTTAADYKLKLSDTVGDTTVTFTKGDTTNAGDYTFTIVPTSDGGKGGKDATTAGIAQAGAINANTGAIDGSKLNKSGKVLVKIVRAAKGGLPALTDYENITVDRQVLGTDVTTIPTISLNSGDNKWKTGNTKFDLKYTNLPGGLSASAFGWGIKSTTASGLLEIDANGKISKATSAGIVIITMTASASNNDKYSGSFDLAAFTIAKQTGTDTLSMADLVVSYVSGDGNKVISTAEILGQLSVSGGQTQKSQWTLVSVANMDNNGDLAVTGSGKTLTISDEITTKTTVTATLSHPAYADKTVSFELSTRAAQVIDGTPTGLSSKWGKSTVTPDYKLKLSDQGQTFVKATDYTFSVVPNSDGGKEGKDATTAGIFSSNPISNARTGAIDTSKLTKSGKLLIKIVRAAQGSGANAVAAATDYVNFDVTKQVLGTDVTTAPAVATATGENGKWKDSTVTKIDLDYTLPGGTRATQYTWAVAKKSSDAPDGTLNIVNGDIRGATSGGTVEITMTATDSNPKYSGSIRTADFTIAKQVLGTDVTTPPAVATATGEDGKWKSSTSAKIALNYTLPGGTTASDYSWAVDKKSGAEPSGTLAIDQTNGHISGATSSGTAEITITAKAANKKYSGSLRTADFAIAKQTVAANTLSVANLVVPYASGSVTVSTSDVLGQLSVTGGTSAKSDWKVKSLTNTDNNSNISFNGLNLSITGAITTSTTITVTFESVKYADVTKTFELSTRARSEVLTTNDPVGSGKWGKSYTTDYKLNLNSGQFDQTTDYTFSIVASGGDDGSGKTPTTAGIIDGNDYTGAINIRTGAITATKLTKSGTLLIKIVRAKSGTTTVTEYYNLTVGKQALETDISKPTLGIPSGTNNIWRDGGGNIPIDFNGLPNGTTFGDFAWTVAGKTGDAPDTTSAGLSITSSGVMGAVSSGTVVVTMKPKGGANDAKYTGQVTFDFAIGKQTLSSNPLRIADISKVYATGNVTISTADIRAQLSVSGGQTQKADWTLKSLSVPQGTTNLAVDSGGKSLTISGAIGTPTGVTATFTHKKYTDVQTSFKVLTQARSMFTQIPTGTGKWGMSGDVLQTYTTNYYLDTTGGFSKGTQTRRGNYTFEIVPSGTRIAGFTSTTSGIVRGNGYSSTINANTGDIAAFNLTRGGTLLIKITRDALSASVPQLVAYQNFTVGKQVLGTDRSTTSTVTTETNEDGTWKDNPSTKIDLKYSAIPPDLQFAWTVARKSGALPTGTLKIDNNGDISGATSGGTVVATITAKVSDPRYTGSVSFEYNIKKQTTTADTLAFDALIVPAPSGGRNTDVSYADILRYLKVTGSNAKTKASEWTVKKVTVPTSLLAVGDNSGLKKIQISQAVPTPTAIGITLEHPAYADKDVNINISTKANPISASVRSGSGKWGKSYTTNYNLRRTVGSVNFVATDYTFSIVAPGGDDGSGKTQTTAGIVQGALTGAINIRTGAIDASKLTKSGTLLVKIVRAAKGGINQTTEYQNFTVDKQTQADHKNFRVTADAIAWSGGVETKVTYKGTNTPAGISDSPTYSLITAGTTAGTVTGDGVGIADVESDGSISGTRASGIVKVKVTYPANDKYEAMNLTVDVPIKRRPGLTVSESAFKVEYNRSYIWGATITPTVTGTMPKSPHDGGTLYVPRYSIKSRTNAGTAAIGGVIDQGTGVITNTQSSGTLVVTVEHPRNIRYEAGISKDITLNIFAKSQAAAANAGHGSFSTGANGTPTISDISSNYKDIRAYGGVLGGIRPTLTINDSGKYPSNGARYQFDYALFKDDGTLLSPSQAITEFNSGKTIRIGLGSNPRSDKAIELVFKFPASPDGKYGNKDLSVYWRTTSATPTTTDSLSFNDFVVTTAPAASGGVNVPSADILTQLKVSSTGTAQTQTSQWTIKKITVPNTAQGISVVSGQGINVNDNLGTATLTITLGHSSYKDKDVTMKVSKRLNPISTGTRSGSGKWGVGTYSTDYKLKTSLTGSGGSTVTFNKNTDYTFEVVTGAVPGDAPAGTQATTAGIIANGQTAIASRTGAIDASKLTKSGVLLVKIVRVAKGGINQTTEYQNFAVSKQDKTDHTIFRVTADAIAWSGGVEKKVTYGERNIPAGISDSPTYSLNSVVMR